jgi:hypothetical protein
VSFRGALRGLYGKDGMVERFADHMEGFKCGMGWWSEMYGGYDEGWMAVVG